METFFFMIFDGSRRSEGMKCIKSWLQVCRKPKAFRCPSNTEANSLFTMGQQKPAPFLRDGQNELDLAVDTKERSWHQRVKIGSWRCGHLAQRDGIIWTLVSSMKTATSICDWTQKMGGGCLFKHRLRPFLFLIRLQKRKKKKHPITYKMTNLWLMTKAENGCDRRRYR